MMPVLEIIRIFLASVIGIGLSIYIIWTSEPIAKVLKREEFVIPTKVGIQSFQYVAKISGFPFARE